MEVLKFLKNTYRINPNGLLDIRPMFVCKDGFRISIQASRDHYCKPRLNIESGEYETVELGFPSITEELIIEYAECNLCLTESVYINVPIDVVEEVIKKHGGQA